MGSGKDGVLLLTGLGKSGMTFSMDLIRSRSAMVVAFM